MSTLTKQLFSQNHWLADGVDTVWNFTFSGGYLDRSHVKAYIQDEDTITNHVIAPADWLGPFQIQITPPVPAGHTLVIYRDTPKTGPLVDFLDGARITEQALDTAARQSVLIGAEVTDFFAIGSVGGLVELAEQLVANQQTILDAANSVTGALVTVNAAVVSTTANATTATNAASSASANATAASNSAAAALGYRNTAQTHADTATTKAGEASSSASAAASSALAAASSASNASSSASSASTSASTAGISASNAASSASSASTSASNASGSASTAASQASIATTQAGNAASSASTASSAASTATTQATNANNARIAAESARDAAQGSAASAGSSASAASTSATNANTSAVNAAASAVAASNSADLAAASAANLPSATTAGANKVLMTDSDGDEWDYPTLGTGLRKDGSELKADRFPVVDINSNIDITRAAHGGKVLRVFGTRTCTLRATGGWSAGDVVTIMTGADADLTLALDGFILHWSGTGSVGSRTVAPVSLVTLVFWSADTAFISGGGIS